MTAETIHTCSYECERPGCIRAQRDELAARLTAETSSARGEWVLVPREPSAGMLDSAENAMIESEWAYNAGEPDARSDAHGFPTMRIWQAVVAYRAMLAAAPQPPIAPVGVDAPGSRAWMAEVCRAAALSLAAHGVRNDQLSKVADWIAQQPAAAEPKTLPVPTRVHLIGETAVIVGTPGSGWDEDAQDAHNCDAMGCATIGPHVLARVPFTDERTLAAAQQGQAVAECHCATCTCAPGMTPAVRFDTSPAAQEEAVRDHLIALGWTPPNTAPPPSAPVGVEWIMELADEYDAKGHHDRAYDLRSLAQQPAAVDGACAVAAIQFALDDPEGMTFLRLWNEGEFETLRREWPEAPSEVYIGADPLATQHQEPPK